jgi:hypothetical protein
MDGDTNCEETDGDLCKTDDRQCILRRGGPRFGVQNETLGRYTHDISRESRRAFGTICATIIDEQ